jgi:guanylate kinase
MGDGMLLIISGPSGSGKGTVVKSLNPEEYALSISVTTRPPRADERDGEDYFFRTREQFDSMRDNDALLEHAVFVGNFYGTPRFYVEDRIREGKTVVLEIEVNGALQVKEKFPSAVLAFLIPPTLDELKRRLINRGTENMETIDRRMKRAGSEIKLIERYDYLVVNDEVKNAAERINQIVRAERLRVCRLGGLISNIRSVGSVNC